MTTTKDIHALGQLLQQYAAHADPSRDDKPEPFRVSGQIGEDVGLNRTNFESFRPSGHEAFDAVISKLGPIFRYGDFWPGYSVKREGARGSAVVARPDQEWITMPNPERFDSMAAYRAIVAHEVVHWTKHRNRSPRPNSGATELDRLFGVIPRGYAAEEMTADFGAAMLLAATGENPVLPERASYIAGWLSAVDSKDRADVMEWARSEAEKAVQYILSR